MFIALLSFSKKLKVVAVFINMLKIHTECSHLLYSSVRDSSKTGFSKFDRPQYNHHKFYPKDLNPFLSVVGGILVYRTLHLIKCSEEIQTFQNYYLFFFEGVWFGHVAI